MANISGRDAVIIALAIVLAFGIIKYANLYPQSTVPTTPTTPTTTIGPGVMCLASDTATLQIRSKNIADLTAATYNNGTYYVYETKDSGEYELATGSLVTGGPYANTTVTCGVSGRVVTVAGSGGVPGVESTYPAFKGFWQVELPAPTQNWQLKLQATSKTGAAHTIFNNNTTAYVNVPAVVPASGLKISPVSSNAANTSNNITDGQTLTQVIYLSNADTKKWYGYKDTYALVSYDDLDWKQEATSATWDAVSAPRTPDASLADFSWYSGKPTAGLQNHFFRIPGPSVGGVQYSAIDGYEHVFKIVMNAVDSIGTMNDVELRFVAYGNYLGTDRKVHYGGVDDTSSHNYVVFTPAKIVIPTA